MSELVHFGIIVSSHSFINELHKGTNMNFSFRQVEIFKAIMITGTVTGASLFLGTSQPTVSRELAQFESSIGMRLFERNKGRLKPTRQGTALYSEVLKSYEGLERVKAAANFIRLGIREKLNIISLPVLSQTILPTSFMRFIERYPDINISLTTRDSPAIENMIASQGFDIGVIEGITPPSGTSIEQVMDIDEVCILPPNHPLISESCIDIHLLRDYSFVHLGPNDPYRYQLDRIFSDHGISRSSIIEVDNAAAICRMVLKGLGISIINPLVARSYVPQGLVLRKLSVTVPFNVSIVRPLSLGTSLVADYLVDCIRQTAAEMRLETLYDLQS
ncbi:LysR family transcriptional regulator [Pseudomonas graminis]|uniref:LysR family transcriptional regulator n=1 Tax=Pseudomonas graminis TaxID=158627 RepID=UPI00234AB990|nr:LysR family transcriptional regulator [Pseudomonas graminis]MDC6382017.1 LysR family transcriptional regulator [Pseudomonas graminis]